MAKPATERAPARAHSRILRPRANRPLSETLPAPSDRKSVNLKRAAGGPGDFVFCDAESGITKSNASTPPLPAAGPSCKQAIARAFTVLRRTSTCPHLAWIEASYSMVFSSQIVSRRMPNCIERQLGAFFGPA